MLKVPPADRPQLESSAVFDATGAYRYRLDRRWQGGPRLAIIMLNPSRADADYDDPTLRRCRQLAEAWGFGSLQVVNLFAYRTPHPHLLRQAADPIGAENDRYLQGTAAGADAILLAWGNEGSWQSRDRNVLSLLKPHWHRCYYIQRNRTGQPRHPLYVPRSAQLRPWLEA